MKLNKKLVKASVFALGFGAVSLFGISTVKATTAAAKPGDSDVTFKVATENIVTSGDKAKFWGIAKEEKNEKNANLKIAGDKNYKVVDVNPIIGNYIDLSSFGKNKELIIAVGSTDTPTDNTWIVKKIPAAVKDFAFEYVTKLEAAKKVKGVNDTQALGTEELGYFVAASKKDTVLDLTAEHANIEVQEGDAAWSPLATFLGAATDDKAKEKLTNYVQTGKTLKFRLKAENSWNSNEVMVKIPSLPAAPKVKFDSSKGTVGMKSTMEYKRAVTGGATDQKFLTATNKMTLSDLEAYSANGIGVKGGTITVRTKADNRKLPSKEAIYTIEKQDAPTVAGTGDNDQEKDVIESNVNVALKVKYDPKKGAVLTNRGSNNYEYFLSYTGAEPTAETKWKKLAAAKMKSGKTTPTKVALKYSDTEKADTFGGAGTKIFFRLAGSKQVENTVKLASKEAGGKLVFKAIEQAVSVDGGNASSSTLAVKVGKEKTHKITFKITNIQNPKKAAKIKVTSKVSGVSVKAAKFVAASGAHTVDVTIKVAKGAFKDESADNKLIFTLSAEGATVEHTCTINATKG